MRGPAGTARGRRRGPDLTGVGAPVLWHSVAMRPVRQEIMWHAVLDAVAATGRDDALRVLDLGGGTGGDAVRLATLGHRVTVADPSPDALASLARRAAEAGVDGSSDGSVTGVLADTSDLAEHLSDAFFDLVLLHGVVEHVDDPAQALRAVVPVLAGGGVLSLVVANRSAAVLARALSGDFDGAATTLDTTAATWDLRTQGPRRFVPDELDALLADAGLRVEQRLALRVFSDLVPSAVVDVEPGARERLWALERRVRATSEFSGISGGLQWTARLDLG